MAEETTARVLSADIRAGIKLDGEQHFGDFFAVDAEGYIVGCCALGAAAIGAGLVSVAVAHTITEENDAGELIDVPNAPSPDLSAVYFDAYQTAATCPVSSEPHSGYDIEEGARPVTAFHLVPHLNDHHTWTREEIADWLASIGL